MWFIIFNFNLHRALLSFEGLLYSNVIIPMTTIIMRTSFRLSVSWFSFFEESLGWRALNPDSWSMTRKVIWYSFLKFAEDSPLKEREEGHFIVRSSKSVLKNRLVEEFRNSSSSHLSIPHSSHTEIDMG